MNVTDRNRLLGFTALYKSINDDIFSRSICFTFTGSLYLHLNSVYVKDLLNIGIDKPLKKHTTTHNFR